MAYIEIIEGVGLELAHLVLIGTFGFGLIIAAKDFRIAIMIWMMMFMGEFILFFQLDSAAKNSWYPCLVAFMLSLVLLVLSLFNSYAAKTRGMI